MRLGRVEVTGGFVLLWALLYYLDDTGILPWAALACALHEGGHWLAIRALGGDVRQISLTACGAAMELSARPPLSPGRLFWAALAGPAANLLAALLGGALASQLGGGCYLFVGLNLGLAGFNLLPAGSLDGGRALESLLAALGREDWGRRAAQLGGDVAAALLLGAGGVLLWQSGGRSFTLLIAGVWMAAAARRERGWTIL